MASKSAWSPTLVEDYPSARIPASMGRSRPRDKALQVFACSVSAGTPAPSISSSLAVYQAVIGILSR